MQYSFDVISEVKMWKLHVEKKNKKIKKSCMWQKIHDQNFNINI